MKKRNSIRELGRKRGLASAKAWQPREPDADTLRMRALHDARGKVIREGCAYTAAGETHWQVRRSAHGRTDQYDLTANGEIIGTAGPRRMPKRFRPAAQEKYRIYG